MNIKRVPCNRLYIRLDKVEERKVAGGRLIVPDMHSERTRVGTVVLVGPDVGIDIRTREFRANRIQPGDRIMVSYTAGVALQFVSENWTPGDDTHRIIVEEEILAVVED